MAIPNQILIDSPTNTISIQTNDNQLHIISPVCNTEVNVTQPSTTVVQVATPGPQGPQGPQGPAGPSGSFVSTGSFATTSSNIFSGNQIITGSLNVSEGITGSLFGTSSYSLNAISASYAQTASYINPLTQNVIITGSLTVSGSNTFINIGPAIFSGSVSTNEGFTGSLQGTSSYSSQALSASFASTASLAPDYVLISATSSMSVATASFAQTASYVQNAQTASYVQNAISASFAQTASYVNTLNQNVLITGSLTVLQGATIYGSSSFVYVTASQLAVSASYISVNVFEPAQRFGGLYVFDSGSSNATASLTWDSLNNHWVYTNSSDSSYTGGGLISGPKNTGSLGQETYPTQNRIVKGQGGDHIMDSNITDTGTIVSINSDTQITGSLNVTGGITGSVLGTSTTASYALTASYVQNAQTASYVLNAISASFASTASLAPNYVLTSTTSSMLAPYVLTSATSSMLAPYVLTSATSSMLAPYVLTSATSSMSVATASYALNATGYDPLTTQHFMQDFAFDNSQASTGGYAVGTNGGSGQGGALLTSHAYTNALGIFRLTSGTTAATGLGLISNGAVAFNWKPSMFALTSVDRINLSAASDATNRYTTRVGFFTQTYNSEPTAGVYFRYTDNTNSGKWQCVCRSASTETVINTTVSPTITPSWQKMEFRCNDAGTSVEFFIDNVSQGSITTNIPTTTYLLKIIVLNKITGSSSQLMDIDYYYTKTTRTL